MFVPRFIPYSEKFQNSSVTQIACSGSDPIYTYDILNRRTSMTSPAGVTTYEYDDISGRLTSITKPGGQKLDFTYNKAQLKSISLPNGITADYNFNSSNNLTSIDYTKDNETKAHFAYSYDKNGMRASTTDLEGLHEYQYDQIYQITKATHPRISDPLEEFAYDAVGNRLTETSSSFTWKYNELNQLLEDHEFTYKYDTDGNMIRKVNKSTNDTTKFIWDIENKLIQVDLPSAEKIEYYYGPLGRRLAKVVNGAAKEYRYDGEHLILELDTQNIIITAYTFGSGRDHLLAMERNSKNYFYLVDGLGSVVALTDTDGNVVQKYSYGVFGNIVKDSGSIENPFTYTVREWDGEAGNYYFRARYYDARIGRFLSEDPIGFTGRKYNLYRYINNNPLNRNNQELGIKTTQHEIKFLLLD